MNQFTAPTSTPSDAGSSEGQPDVCCAICSQKITGHYGTALGAGVHLELMGCVEALTQRVEAAEAERDRLQPWYDGYMKVADAICAGSTGPDDLTQQARAIRAERDAWVNKFEDLSSMTGAERRLDRDRMYKLEAERDALRKDAARLDWLEKAAKCAIEVESFIGADNEKNAVFLEWAWDDIPPDFVRSVPKRISQGRTLRAALDAALAVQPTTEGSHG